MSAILHSVPCPRAGCDNEFDVIERESGWTFPLACCKHGILSAQDERDIIATLRNVREEEAA